MKQNDELFQINIHLKGGGVEALVERTVTGDDDSVIARTVLDGATGESPIINDDPELMADAMAFAAKVKAKIAARHKIAPATLKMVDGSAVVTERLAERKRVADEAEEQRLDQERRIVDADKEKK